MIHSSYYRPKVFSNSGDLVEAEIDRAQELTASTTINREKVKEIGRDGIVDWRQRIPSINLTLRQLEYGSMEFWRQLTGKGNSVTQVSWTDFKTATFDIAGYKTDDNGTFLGTIYYPKLRTASLSINAGSPDGFIERSFSFVGEDEIMLQNANKYLICQRYVIASGGNNCTVTVNTPSPVADPDNSTSGTSVYFFKVVKHNVTTGATVLNSTDYSYVSGTGVLTINGASATGDVIRVWFSAGTYTGTVFTNNDADLAGITADSCSIYLASSNYLYRLQSAGIEVTFDREDIKEIGNLNTVSYGIRNITTRVTLGRILEAFTIEEVLRGKAGASWGKLDVRQFQDNLSLIVKVYTDASKRTFKLGYKLLDLAPTATEAGTPTADYVTRGATLEGEVGFVTSNEAAL